MIRSKRKTLSLEVRSDGDVLVRAPVATRDSVIRDFVDKKRPWIEKAIRQAADRMGKRRVAKFEEGETFLFLGKEFQLHIAEDMYGKLLFEDRFILSARWHSKARRLLEKWYKEEAFYYFTKHCNFFSSRMHVRYSTIRLTGARTRWGTCAPGGRLRFNWRLVMAPPEIIDYVVIHELAHLKQPNHSRKFWEIVESEYPDRLQAKHWLKENQFRLQF